MVGITGLGSGMNIDSIVSSLVAAERAPKEAQLARLEKATTTKITSIGALRGAIGEFQSAIAGLNKIDLFQSRTARSTNTDAVVVSANTSAVAGKYSVEVKSLAAGSKIALGAIPSATTFGNGTLSIKVGGQPPLELEVGESNNTLAGIRDAINKAGASQGLSATIVNDTSGQRLVLSSSKTGDGNDIAIASSGDASLAALEFDPSEGMPDLNSPDFDPKAARMLAQASSARLSIDGLEVLRDSNTISDAIDGVTFTLKELTGANKPVTVEVALDRAGARGNIQRFIDAYNKLVGVINSETKVVQVGEGKAPVTGGLVGDATARNVQRAIYGEISGELGEGALRSLADLGITTQKDGTLRLDGAKLEKVLSENYGLVAGLFTGTNGLVARLDAKLKPYTEAGGILEQRSKAMTDTIKQIDKQKIDLSRRVTVLQERLYKQFNAMDALVGQLSATSNSLAAALDNLPGFVNSNKRK